MGFFSRKKSRFADENKPSAHNASNVEEIINEINNEPFAASTSNVMYTALGEIAGYHLLQSVIIGTLKVKTFKGANLKIKGIDFELDLNSDMLEFESELSNHAHKIITKIDFEIDKEDLPKMEKSKIESIELTVKKECIKFHILNIVKEVQSTDEEE